MRLDITRILAEEYHSLREICSELRNSPVARKRSVAENFLPLLTAHTFAEEEALFSRVLELDSLRTAALKTLEEHELVENELLRLWQSVDDEQFGARAGVFCDLLELQWRETEENIFPELRRLLSEDEREEMATRYREIKEQRKLDSLMRMPDRGALAQNQAGRVGYLFAWILGVPAWLVLMVFLIRG